MFNCLILEGEVNNQALPNPWAPPKPQPLPPNLDMNNRLGSSSGSGFNPLNFQSQPPMSNCKYFYDI